MIPVLNTTEYTVDCCFNDNELTFRQTGKVYVLISDMIRVPSVKYKSGVCTVFKKALCVLVCFLGVFVFIGRVGQ